MVAQGIGTAVGLIGSTLASGMFTNAGAVKSYRFSRALQEHAAKLNYDYGQKALMNNASSMRKGLVNAGYNPMLAVQNSTSGANSSFTSATAGPNVDYSGALNSAVSNAQSFQRLKNETMQAESATDANYANADKAKAEKASLIERLPWISKREKAEYMKTTMETAKIENDIHLANEMLKLQQTGVDVNVKSYQLEKAIQDIVRNREDRYKKWGEEHPILRNIDETINRYIGKPSFGATKKL